MSSPARLLIFGSCVSRDIFNYPQASAQFVLVDYYARCSLASLGAQPIEMPSSVQNIRVNFQRRMVERDIKKDFLNDLARLQFDVLLIDLIDERFNLYVEPERRVCTLSSELLSTGFLQSSDRGSGVYSRFKKFWRGFCPYAVRSIDRGSKVSSGSAEFWRLWEAGWSTLLSQLRHFGVLDRLRVNQVFWSSRTENGGNFDPDYSDRQIALANQSLERMYQRISADIPSEQFLRFDHRLMMGSISHKWGISPFHYIDAYYHAAIQQLSHGLRQ